MYYRTDISHQLQRPSRRIRHDLPPPKTWSRVRPDRAVLTDKYGTAMLRRGLLPRSAVRQAYVPGALPHRGRQVLRRRHHEGDDQQRRRRQGVHRDARREQVHAAGRRDTGASSRTWRRSWPGPDRDDDLLAALWPLGRGLRHRRGGAVTGCRSRRSRARSATPCRRAAIPSSPPASALAVASDSKHKEPAYLFIQWLNSEDICIERVQLPYALRDPFRNSHYTRRRATSRAGRTPSNIWPP